MRQNTLVLLVSGLLHLAILLILSSIFTSSPLSFYRPLHLSPAEADIETAIEELSAATFDTNTATDYDMSTGMSIEVKLPDSANFHIGRKGSSGIGLGGDTKSPKISDSRIDFANISEKITHTMDSTSLSRESNTAILDALPDDCRNLTRISFLESLSKVTPASIEAVAFISMEETDFEKISELPHSSNRDFLISQMKSYDGKQVSREGPKYRCDLVFVLHKEQLPAAKIRRAIDLQRTPLLVICIKTSPEIDKSVEKLVSDSIGEYHRM